MSRFELVSATRRGAGLFRKLPRGVIEVSGNDRTRWLQGMVSNDVERLEAGTTRSGCYATLLTPKGRIVADLQVMLRGDLYWLDLARDAVSTVLERLDRYVIADDIALADRSAAIERLGLEGPAALEIFAAAADNAPRLGRDACAEVRIAGADVLVAAFGWTGEAAVQIFAPAQAGDVIAEAIAVAGADRGLVTGDFEVLETLRIEAGIPRLGAELDESVLPAEAGLDRAVATDKGCFTGQEVVERLRTQGSVSHRLIGISVDGDEPLAVGAQVFANGKRVGEVTSACTSPVAGAIALAFVRRAHAEPGSQVEIGDRKGRVASLPFAAEGAPH